MPILNYLKRINAIHSEDYIIIIIIFIIIFIIFVILLLFYYFLLFLLFYYYTNDVICGTIISLVLYTTCALDNDNIASEVKQTPLHLALSCRVARS